MNWDRFLTGHVVANSEKFERQVCAGFECVRCRQQFRVYLWPRGEAVYECACLCICHR